MTANPLIGTTEVMRCPLCRGDRVSVLSRRIDRDLKGRGLVSFEAVVSKCDDCGEEFLTPDQSIAHSRALAAATSVAEGVLGPTEIRRCREALEMTQAQFEAALGVGRKTVVRWERGTVSPSRAANALLWIAFHYPDAFLAYARQGSQRRLDDEPKEVVGFIASGMSGPPVVHVRRTKGLKSRTSTGAMSWKIDERRPEAPQPLGVEIGAQA